MSLHGVLELLAARFGLEIELGVEREELVLVAVGSVARRRTGSAVPVLAEAVGALRRRMSALVESTVERVDAPGDPVGEVSDRSVGIVDDQREGPSALGGALQSIGGETLSPSQEYFRGIGCPSLNAMLVSSNSGTLRSFLFAGVVSQTDWGLDTPLG
jgi:hypothetical protein